MKSGRAESFSTLVIGGTLIAAAAFAFVLYQVDRALHGRDGPTHVFELAGDAPLTDQQALDFAQRAMTLDGRMSPKLKLERFDDGSGANFGDDKRFCSVSWLDESNFRWFATIRRKPGKVEVFTHPGK